MVKDNVDCYLQGLGQAIKGRDQNQPISWQSRSAPIIENNTRIPAIEVGFFPNFCFLHEELICRKPVDTAIHTRQEGSFWLNTSLAAAKHQVTVATSSAAEGQQFNSD